MPMYPPDFYPIPTQSAAADEKEPYSPRRVDAPLVESDSYKPAPGTLNIAIRFTIVTTILLGILYPLVVTGLAQLTMRNKADGQLILRDGHVVGSKLIAQSFTSDRYFHERPSAAGNGYDATSSGGSNLGPTNQKLIDRINTDAANDAKQNPGPSVPIDLVTTSGSGLDPDITPHIGRDGTRAGSVTHPGSPVRNSGRVQGQRPGTQPRTGRPVEGRGRSTAVRK